ncbi:galactoside 2-alpha-L-fucosyltransferase-like [Phragmites australis]|uniref:galactoside 2-alpha-L-fucosyltransferase-like n=1 Tax=Phragmites australis TaxID=29695 RepID=UPI002D79BF22|nr:galactoside 2-alpha-L-fucosyltransferase-like [Phragmites australis]
MAAKKMKKQADVDRRWSWMVSAVLAAFLMTVAPLAVVLGWRNVGAPAVWIDTAVAGLRQGSNGLSFLDRRTTRYDRLLGGLLNDGFDFESCHSRYQSAMYRRNAGRRPSSYLISKLRRHEALQRRCGPGTAVYSNALEQLKFGKSVALPECRYIVSISYRGLGNRILAAASAFLYAVLTDRVLLIDPSNEMGQLFCEPFPNTTWLLPPGFPLTDYTNFSIDTAESYGNMLKNKVIGTTAAADVSPAQVPAFAYVHLDHDASIHDKCFYWDEDQGLLRHIQWLVMRTDQYIVPGLFLAHAFQEELDLLFPEPDTVFHHLGRYLFHPNNHVWGLVTRYYDAYLAAAQHRVGIQVRVFGAQPNSPELLEQITTCTQKEKLLPEVLTSGEPILSAPSVKTKALLVTSLKSWYYENIKSMYWEHATATGEAVSVHQPSHEEFQRFGAKSHDTKAWAEIYLLSLTDALVTTAWSTFGYVAQGLGGLRPWVMYKPANDTQVPDPPCGRDVSMEPCFLKAPGYDSRLNRWVDITKIVPHVQRCGDAGWGVKLVGRNE